MKPIHFYIIFCAVIISISGCSTGKNALKKGDYYEATMQAVTGCVLILLQKVH
jgi:hypothetical protein